MSRATEPAFPVPGMQTDSDFNGLSVREEFAKAAMQGFCSRQFAQGEPTSEHIAAWAVDQADQLLAALSKDRP